MIALIIPLEYIEKTEVKERTLPGESELRNGVIGVWVKAWEDSEWEDVADCPWDPTIKDCSLVKHHKFVMATAMAMSAHVHDIWQIFVDNDVLLAGAALHDVCDVVDYAPEKGTQGKRSAIGENTVHGTYGVHLALNANLPLEVVHLISFHTTEVLQFPKFIEGILLCHADYTASDIFHLREGKPLQLSKK